jgi:hypothetical protein
MQFNMTSNHIKTYFAFLGVPEHIIQARDMFLYDSSLRLLSQDYGLLSLGNVIVLCVVSARISYFINF